MRIGQNVKNGFINSKFDYWQRVGGNSTNFATSVFTADRWRWGHAGDGGTPATGAIQRQNAAAGVFDNQTYFMRVTNSSQGSSLGVNSLHYLSHTIEDVRSYAGKKIVVSVWLSSTISSKTFAASCVQNFGSGGSSSVDVSTNVTKTLSGSLTRYDFEITVPSIVGKTIGTGSYLEIGLIFQAGSTMAARFGLPAITWQGTGNIDIYRAMICEGTLSTLPDYEMAGKTLGQELRFCQRYYEKSYDIDTVPGTVTSAGAMMLTSANANAGGTKAPSPFKVTKRIVPVVTVYNPNSLNVTGSMRNVSGSADIAAAIDAAIAGTSLLCIGNTANSTIAHVHIWHWTADAEF